MGPLKEGALVRVGWQRDVNLGSATLHEGQHVLFAGGFRTLERFLKRVRVKNIRAVRRLKDVAFNKTGVGGYAIRPDADDCEAACAVRSFHGRRDAHAKRSDISLRKASAGGLAVFAALQFGQLRLDELELVITKDSELHLGGGRDRGNPPCEVVAVLYVTVVDLENDIAAPYPGFGCWSSPSSSWAAIAMGFALTRMETTAGAT